MPLDSTSFFQIQSNFDIIPFNQTEEWLISNYYNHLEQIVYFVDNKISPKIGCWGIVHNRKLIGKHLVIDGESFNEDISHKQITSFYNGIIELGFSLVDVSNISIYKPNYEIGIRRSGFSRPFGLTLSPLTLIINLQDSFNFHRNWKRNVKKALDENVIFRYIEYPSEENVSTFIKLFNELKERKKLGFNLNLANLITLLKSENYKLFFVFNEQGFPIAARIVYIHKQKSYDLYAANTYEALKCGAIYYLQEQILIFLKSINLESFDYGRIPPGKDEMDAIYIAKSYSNGVPKAYNGQWQFSKSKFSVLLIALKIFYLKGNKRY